MRKRIFFFVGGGGGERRNELNVHAVRRATIKEEVGNVHVTSGIHWM
jgi:hypothetical protein